MRRAALLCAAMMVMVTVFAGTALAVNKVCKAREDCRGTSQADGLTGTKFADRIFGLGGDDIIYGHQANDRVFGGPGNDFLRGDSGNDTINGQSGLDSVIGSGGNDRLIGDAPKDKNGKGDNIAGGPGDDVEIGGPGNDLLGNIVFDGVTIYDRGEDKLSGGPGNDRFYTADGDVDTINCGPGKDTVYKDPKDKLSNPNACETVWNKVRGNNKSSDGALWSKAGSNSRDKGEVRSIAGEAIPAAVPSDAKALAGE